MFKFIRTDTILRYDVNNAWNAFSLIKKLFFFFWEKLNTTIVEPLIKSSVKRKVSLRHSKSKKERRQIYISLSFIFLLAAITQSCWVEFVGYPESSGCPTHHLFNISNCGIYRWRVLFKILNTFLKFWVSIGLMH